MASKALLALLVCLFVGVVTARNVRSTDVKDDSPQKLIWQQLTDEEKEWFSGIFPGDKNNAMKKERIAEILEELNKVQPGIAENMPRIYDFLVNPKLVPYIGYEYEYGYGDDDDDYYDSDEDEEYFLGK